MFLGQQSSKNNVKESCVPYVCFAGRHTLKNKCEEQPYVAVQFIIWRKPKVQRFIYICVHHSQKTNIKTSDQIWSNTCVGLNLIKCWFQIFCLGMMCPKKSRKQGFDFCLEGTMVTHSEKKKRKATFLYNFLWINRSTDALNKTRSTGKKPVLTVRFGKKNIYRVFLDAFLWNDGAKKWKQEINVFLFFCVEGGLQSRKNSRKTWTFFGNCWGNDGH